MNSRRKVYNQHLVVECGELNTVSLLCVVGSAVDKRNRDLVGIWLGQKRSLLSESYVPRRWLPEDSPGAADSCFALLEQLLRGRHCCNGADQLKAGQLLVSSSLRLLQL